MKRLATALIVLLVTASVAPLAASGQQADGSTYAGTHVSFETENRAMTDYAVDGEQLLGSVKIQSTESAESGGLIDVGASLEAVTSLDGSALSVGAKTKTSATVTTESSAKMQAHDNENGIIVVESGGESQYVQANLSGDAQAQSESEKQVSVTTENGTDGTFVVVGDGEVTVNEEGNVTAKLGEDGRLVFRAYPDGKSDDDQKQEQLIANGTAAAEVHVMQESGETVIDTVNYSQDTSVEVKQSAENRISLTVDRASHEGTVLITSVSESAVESTDSLRVTVDGEAAAKASSYSELAGAIGGDQSKYMVRQQGSAEASADVLVAVNHFSTRTVAMGSSGDDGSTTDEATTTGSDGESNDDGASDDGTSDSTSPNDGQSGFGVVVALVALIGAVLLAREG